MTNKVAVATYRGVEKLMLKRKVTKAPFFKPNPHLPPPPPPRLKGHDN